MIDPNSSERHLAVACLEAAATVARGKSGFNLTKHAKAVTAAGIGGTFLIAAGWLCLCG
jgi:hypothetical protein